MTESPDHWPELPELSENLSLARKLEYRRRQMEGLAGLIADSQQRGEDLSWVPAVAVQMLAGVARDLAKWSAEIEP